MNKKQKRLTVACMVLFALTAPMLGSDAAFTLVLWLVLVVVYTGTMFVLKDPPKPSA